MGAGATPGSRGKIAAAPRAAEGRAGPLLPIGALAKRTRCNIDTIRFYEKIGMLPKPARTEGGQRAYSPALVERLAFVRRTRELGFTLDEVRALLRLVDQRDGSCDEVRAVAREHLADVKAKIADLRAMQAALVDLIAKCDAGNGTDCPLIEALLHD